ncbi:MAG TPA: 2'-5' RNA ligase family protein [Flavisolibacter sp.]|nr:2'-5' RNA ligase family protein [Flavisolibacter sp.]
MNLQLSLFPHDRNNEIDECLLIVSPDVKVANSVLELKKGTRFLCGEEGIISRPHITIARVYISRRAEYYILSLLQTICSRHQKFIVELEGFSSFEHPNSTCTIYIKVKEHQPFLDLAKDLKALRRDLKKLGCRIDCVVNNPHLSLIRGLPFTNYKAAMPIYGDSTFRDSFVAEEILLSKRWTPNYGSHRVAFPLSPLN